MTIGDANSAGNAAALLTSGPYTIARPVTVNGRRRPHDLGNDQPPGNSIFTGLTLNGGNTVTLSSPAGGTVNFGAIGGSGTGALVIAAPSNITINGADTSAAPTLVSGGTLTVNGTLGGSGATTVNGGVLNLGGSGSLSSGGTTTVAFAGMLAGGGTISSPMVVNGGLEPSLTAALNFAGSASLTMNGGSTFVLQASGGQVGQVQGVANFRRRRR